jgi:arylsulfatase A-like enzyme/tetratricopeptide (TPR) repeat protein
MAASRPQLRSKKIFTALLAVVAAGVVGVSTWLAWRRATQPGIKPGACAGCNVLLITVDTLRVDRVGAFGGRAGLTPHLDRLASEGLRFTRAYSAAPLTLPSHASIFTAVPPPVHGLRANGLFRLGPGLPTLATVLESSGYRTGAFVGAFVLDARFGLNRGFDVYDDRYGEKAPGDPAEGAERRAEDVVKPALAWIAQAASDHESSSNQPSAVSHQPWFAWLHLYDPHEPYRAPEPYASRHDPYDAEVAYTDAVIGRLLDDLRAAGRLDRTLVVVAADHGESLGEHGERTHGVFVYDVTMRVPLIVWAGARVTPGASDALARLIDLAPTALDVLGVQKPASFEGRSLIASTGDAAAASTAYVEAMDASLTRGWAPLTGLVAGDYKLIELPIPEIYNLRSDPGETTNLFARDAERARMLESILHATVEQGESRGSPAEKTTLGADARQRLQALGYVASSVDSRSRVYTDADDPKTLIGPSNELQRAVTTFNAGARAEAMKSVREIMQRHPRFATAPGVLASMQRESGDLRGAIATLEDAARRGLLDQTVMVVLAGYLQQAGDADRAAQVLSAVIAAHPDYAEAHNSLGVIYARTGQHDRARASLRRVLELDPTSARAYENLAADELSTGEIERAIDDLRRALDLDPHLYDALFNLAMALDGQGRRAEAKPYMERFVKEAPAARYAPDIARFRALLDR